MPLVFRETASGGYQSECGRYSVRAVKLRDHLQVFEAERVADEVYFARRIGRFLCPIDACLACVVDDADAPLC